jgi:Amt family ammonium transporter
MKLSSKIAIGTGVAGMMFSALPVWAQDAAAAPVPNKGDTAWMIVATVLVLAMAVPGLALFYGGLVRSKNMLSMLTQVLGVFSIGCLTWICWGYSIALSDGNAFFGGLSRLFLSGINAESTAATFTDGVVIPEYVFVAFQMTFASITAALVVGSLAERSKFTAVMLFAVLWVTFVYAPIAHMVWYTGGFIFEMGALDYAGGTVVHINAGVAGLVGAIILGKRTGYPHEPMPPHSLVMTLLGTGLLWAGWMGFNGGSGLEANGGAGLTILNTFAATAAGVVTWLIGEQILKGKPSLLGAASGAIAGLVAITPGAGIAGPIGAIFLGIFGAIAALLFIDTIKKKLGVDDTADVFGIHGVAGIVGSIGTGIAASASLGGIGMEPTIGAQVVTQIIAVAIAIAWSAIGSAIIFFALDKTIGLRVPVEEEVEGLDISTHGERAYNL